MNNLVKKGTSFFKEFQNFAVKGNVMDMAIGVVIGTAFGKIVSSLVADIIMPLIGLFVGSIDFKDLAFNSLTSFVIPQTLKNKIRLNIP